MALRPPKNPEARALINENDMAGAASPGMPEDTRNPDEAREIFVMKLDKDFSTSPRDEKDFRPRPESEGEAPKVSSAADSATLPNSVTGLEDVSKDDLDDPANPAVKKDTSQAITSVDGSPTFSKVT